MNAIPASGLHPHAAVNTVESHFAILKRGITGVYHHISEARLKRYLAEFDFRYSDRFSLGVIYGKRTAKALKDIEGKRLTYGPTNQDRSQKAGC